MAEARTWPVAHQPTSNAVHTYFGLTYANYHVLPRTLMQSMPDEWQEQMVRLLRDLDDAYPQFRVPGYEVRVADWVPVGECARASLFDAGIVVHEEYGLVCYYDREGHELDPVVSRAPIYQRDPVPHYDRGRTFVPPAPREDPSDG